jgi:hypothetical protein
MKRKKSVVIWIVLTMIPLVLTGKVVNLPQLVNPFSITAEGDKLYITERTTVYIFSAKDFKLLKKFGQQGEGPGEFMTSPGFNITLALHPDYLVINSPGKLSRFSKQGKFIKEQKSPFPLPNMQPLGEAFVGFSLFVVEDVRYLTFYLYDQELKKTRQILKTVSPFQQVTSKHDPFIQFLPFRYQCKHDRVFICELNEVIHVLDVEGNKLFELKYDFKQLKVTDEIKQGVYEIYRTHPGTKNRYEMLKKLVKFPKMAPPMRGFHVANRKIYVLPYAKENGENYFYIFDLTGKFEKKIPLPLKDRNIFELYPYAHEGSKLYQLVENEEDEWDLHAASIDGT